MLGYDFLETAAPSPLAALCTPFAPASYWEVCRSISRACNARWQELWSSAADHAHLRAIKPTPVRTPHCWSGPRARDRTLLLLRHGHCLNNHHRRVGRLASAVCPHAGCGQEETVEHFLLHCRGYAEPRRALSEAVSAVAGPDTVLSLPLLLGSAAPVQSRAAIGGAVLQFVVQSGRVLQDPLLRV